MQSLIYDLGYFGQVN